jgi:heme/copper-type cytochrome/quinol oxidase subunit 2
MNKLVILFALMLTACAARAPGDGTAAPSSPSGARSVFTVSSSRPMAQSSRARPLPSQTLRRINVTASGGMFLPEVIAAQRGERVQLLVSGPDAPFVFAIPQLRIQEHVQPGRSTAVDLPTDTTGSFEFRCADSCRAGHEDRRGEIVIR